MGGVESGSGSGNRSWSSWKEEEDDEEQVTVFFLLTVEA